MFAYLSAQETAGNLTHAEFLAKWHAAQTAGNVQARGDMSEFADTIAAAMLSSARRPTRG